MYNLLTEKCYKLWIPNQFFFYNTRKSYWPDFLKRTDWTVFKTLQSFLRVSANIQNQNAKINPDSTSCLTPFLNYKFKVRLAKKPLVYCQSLKRHLQVQFLGRSLIQLTSCIDYVLYFLCLSVPLHQLTVAYHNFVSSIKDNFHAILVLDSEWFTRSCGTLAICLI